MTDKKRFPLVRARAIAQPLCEIWAPYVEQIEIAGSIRRGKAEVGDIEILYIPKLGEAPTDLFGNAVAEPEDMLDTYLQRLIEQGVYAKRGGYGPLNKLLIHVPSGIPLDVFATTADNWGMSLVIRTGPKEFNVRLMQRFRELGMSGHAYAGVTDRDGQPLDCPTEHDVFRHAQWDYVEPEDRR